MKFLGIPGYEIQFYKLLNVNVATLRLQTVFLSYIRITTFLELFQLPSSSPSLFLNSRNSRNFFTGKQSILGGQAAEFLDTRSLRNYESREKDNLLLLHVFRGKVSGRGADLAK